jgi:hypothetical protein
MLNANDNYYEVCCDVKKLHEGITEVVAKAIPSIVPKQRRIIQNYYKR